MPDSLKDMLASLLPDTLVQGSLFPEPLQIISANIFGKGIRLSGVGESSKLYKLDIPEDRLSEIKIIEQGTFSGNAQKFRLAVEALRLGLAYEYDPYFSLSIAKVDPLPHQLEAVYDYFLKAPRIRFLLADDPGAGKTIMAGLLIKELKARGLIRRILIVTPANLTFQWQREMKDKFREDFKIIRGDVLRANYGSNPWQEQNQVITSVAWASLQEDANQSLLRTTWDLVIVDEAHKMSAQDDEHKTYAYQLGEELSERTDHFLLMTATPHKGDQEQFRLFLRLLDKDVYADIKSLEEAVKRQEAPFYLRRVKEALVTFPSETGVVKSLFTKRVVNTIEFQIDREESDFYQALTKYVEDQSIRAAIDNSPRGRAVGFTMAMLQRRFASSLYAVRKSLERMRTRREQILRDPDAWRQQQIEKRLPDNYDDLPEEEQQEILEELEAAVITHNPEDLRRDIGELTRLIDQARELENQEVESKIVRLKKVLSDHQIFSDSKVKLLIFTEHKETLDYLAADGRDGKPIGKLREWGLSVTQIYGGMKVGDRNMPGTRICAEREFKEEAQIMVATEAAGEGINLQFCWLMINYDIPWNPIRLEQRMGRIHRYGQERDCLILNFVSTNTREGRVMQKLFERITSIEKELDPGKTGKIFNVLGDVFPSNLLEKMLRDMYARNYDSEAPILDRIQHQVDVERFRQITNSTLEGLAKKELNLSAIVGKSAEARERRLVPEVIESFFMEAAPMHGIQPKLTRKESGIYSIGKIPRNLWSVSEKLEPRFGMLGREYKQIAFSKEVVNQHPALDWVTPGHPLFETIREETFEKFREDLRKGAVFYSLKIDFSIKLDLFSSDIVDGRGKVLHRRLFVTESLPDGKILLRQPTLFLDIIPVEEQVSIPSVSLPERHELEEFLVTTALHSYLEEIQQERLRETQVVEKHLKLSLEEVLRKQNMKLGEMLDTLNSGDEAPNLHANIKLAENRILELNHRLDTRLKELAKERQCTIANTQHLGVAWVLPHPERERPEYKGMHPDEEIERLAVEVAIKYEHDRGFVVESVETENKGFDLISRRAHPEDPKTAIEVRFIEVKGRAAEGEVWLSKNEYETALRLRKEYFLYVVYNCATQPRLHIIQDPATHIAWEPVVKIEHYRTRSSEIYHHAHKQ